MIGCACFILDGVFGSGREFGFFMGEETSWGSSRCGMWPWELVHRCKRTGDFRRLDSKSVRENRSNITSFTSLVQDCNPTDTQAKKISWNILQSLLKLGRFLIISGNSYTGLTGRVNAAFHFLLPWGEKRQPWDNLKIKSNDGIGICF